MSCEHDDSEYLEAIKTAGEVRWCAECQRYYDIADKNTGYGDRPLTVAEMSELIEAEITYRLDELKRQILAVLNVGELPF